MLSNVVLVSTCSTATIIPRLSYHVEAEMGLLEGGFCVEGWMQSARVASILLELCRDCFVRDQAMMEPVRPRQ